MPRLVAGLTTSTIVVAVLGLVAFLLGFVRLQRRAHTNRVLEMPQPERTTALTVPGSGFDRKLRELAPETRDRVKSAAVALLSQNVGSDDSAVRQRIERGTWTEDEEAVAFLSSKGQRRFRGVRSWLGGDPTVVHEARAAVSALSRIQEAKSGNRDGGDPTSVRSRSGAPNVESGGGGEDAGRGQPARLAADNGKVPGAPQPGSSVDRMTGRWYGVGVLTLFTIAVAVISREPDLLVVATIGLALSAYAAYGRAGSAVSKPVVVGRQLETERPVRGESVEVTVTVRNKSDRFLPNVRVVDGVPAQLVVTEGSPRCSGTLRPDGTLEYSYTLIAEYGGYEFDSPVAVLYDITGERERILRPAGDDTVVVCRPPPEKSDDLSGRSRTTGYIGQITSDEGGSGIEFHAIRNYRSGDPLARIDWKRLARTGELTTIQFRQDRMVKVVLIVDVRTEAYCVPGATERDAISRCVEAADILAHTLLTMDNRVGVTALPMDSCWVAPGSGNDHRQRIREILTRDPPFTDFPATDQCIMSVELSRFRQRLPADAQVVLLSPLTDDYALEFVQRLETTGVPTTVISPDPTTDGTAGRDLAELERRNRLVQLRQGHIPSYDWAPREALTVALANVSGGGGR